MFTPDHPAYDWFGLNQRLFTLINGARAPLVDWTMLPISTLSHPSLYPYYLAIALWFAWRRPSLLPVHNVVVFASGYVVVSALLIPVLKGMFDFPRPLTVLGTQVHVLGIHDSAQAFPSGHAAFAVLAACSLAPGAPRPFRLAIGAFAVLVCISRVSVGAHFPADVIGGGLVGALVTVGLRKAIRSAPSSPRGSP